MGHGSLLQIGANVNTRGCSSLKVEFHTTRPRRSAPNLVYLRRSRSNIRFFLVSRQIYLLSVPSFNWITDFFAHHSLQGPVSRDAAQAQQRHLQRMGGGRRGKRKREAREGHKLCRTIGLYTNFWTGNVCPVSMGSTVIWDTTRLSTSTLALLAFWLADVQAVSGCI